MLNSLEALAQDESVDAQWLLAAEAFKRVDEIPDWFEENR